MRQQVPKVKVALKWQSGIIVRKKGEQNGGGREREVKLIDRKSSHVREWRV